MANFRQLISGSIPVLIYFFSESYPLSKSSNTVMMSIAKEMGEQVRVLKISLDKNPLLAGRMLMNKVPTVMIFKGETLFFRQSGIVHKAQIMKAFRVIN